MSKWQACDQRWARGHVHLELGKNHFVLPHWPSLHWWRKGKRALGGCWVTQTKQPLSAVFFFLSLSHYGPGLHLSPLVSLHNELWERTTVTEPKWHTWGVRHFVIRFNSPESGAYYLFISIYYSQTINVWEYHESSVLCWGFHSLDECSQLNRNAP